MPVQGTLSDFLPTPHQDWVAVPDDLISEESDFHGNADTKSFYNKLAASYNPRDHWSIHEWNLQVIAEQGKQAQKEAAAARAKKDAKQDVKTESTPNPSSAGLRHNAPQDRRVKYEDAKPSDESDRLAVDTVAPAADAAGYTTKDSEQEEVKPHNYYEGQELAKQLAESLADFLKRLPPSTTTTARGPWIWIANPYPSLQRNSAGKRVTDPESQDVAAFRQLGTRLLEDFSSRKEEVEAKNPGKAPGTITRILRPDRIGLESAIRDLARQKNVTCGKWMLFPHASDVDWAWSVVARGVWEGKLGISAKVATAPPVGAAPAAHEAVQRARDREERLICVYTYDFWDKNDVKRVLLGLKQLGLLNGDNFSDGSRASSSGNARVIYYKCDAYTYLDISSNNKYKLKASMYNSRDMLAEG
ncbi:hypothetical protein LTR20_008862 [Exophiala xenobiotica]|nr:hypothetical protein LTR40_006786 [Exophiala xenobiotica]KAK5364926.1 hypothetical protein LTS13_008753 [Exophiala xenobiotica]KAK5392610.1 hypothetical protein LTR79_010076 [Exophiala xenobiotica]KAK5424243.1 hypothetical protein LTR90_001589 [Exophiala xenobiotica]KAK5457511.1 hypothetical protein LTR20_008862 [Exophiala xenobiotica]